MLQAVDGVVLEEARTSERYTGRHSQEGVRFATAEAAVRALHLRTVDVETKKRKREIV